MRLRLAVLILLSLPMLAQLKPPATQPKPVTETLHGVTIDDPYRWLEDQKSPETRAWINRQIQYTNSWLSKTASRPQIRARLRQITKFDQVTAPRARAGKYFFQQRLAGEDRFSILMRTGAAGQDETIVNPAQSTKGPKDSVNLEDVTDDARLLAYSVRLGGEDELSYRILDLKTRTLLPDTLPRHRYFGFNLHPRGDGYFYAKWDDKNGPKVYWHKMGSTDPDPLIFGQGIGPDKFVDLAISNDGRWLAIIQAEGVPPTNFVIYALDTTAKTPTPAKIVSGLPGEFNVSLAGDYLFLHTNHKAKNWRLLRVDLRRPDPANWKEVLPESAHALTDVALAAGRIVATTLESVQPRLRLYDLEGKPSGEIRLPGLGTAEVQRASWSGSDIFYTFQSFLAPLTLYRAELDSGAPATPWRKIQAPVDPAHFDVKQVWYHSKDKTKIPMFVVHRKGLERDGARPTYLWAYGGFNVTITPTFSPMAVLMAEQNGVFAIPNLRGGGEFGEAWHESGMFERKQNVFDDFYAAAEHLITERYTSPWKLAIGGGSNGGLLVGAALTQRPDLFRAVLCGVPLLDMLRYHKFGWGRMWATEYGSADDPRQFEYLRKYSPYHNVRKDAKYPAVMIYTGDSDTRVDPLHARKMAALLQAANQSDRPMLLRYDTEFGHSPGMPLSEQIDLLSDQVAFLYHELGVEPGPAAPANPQAFNGKWDIRGPGRAWWLKIEGAGTPQLRGEFVGAPGGQLDVIPELSIKDGELTFVFDRSYAWMNNKRLRNVYRAQVVDDRLDGVMETEVPRGEAAPVRFTGVRAPEIPGRDDGSWKPGKTIELFNGKDLSGWRLIQPDRKEWLVAGNILVNEPGAADLESESKFWNFDLRVEYRIGKGSNSGIGLRGRYEVQIFDDFGQPPAKGGNGALYSRIVPTRNVSKAPGEWQVFDIRLIGREVTVKLNGAVIIDRKLIDGLTAMATDPDEGEPGPIT
ncbi:MAG: prolyl oligopeptidase family serine peptidase, partial [Bryobacteraceae bacterium]|nr:prolyl oligopeptidase family serine peptidase [Bryobacteraceae bacterium]